LGHHAPQFFKGPALESALQPKDDPFGPVECGHGCRGWLRSLGLGQYKALFRVSEIDADILPELTDVDLEKLGVPLGHRKRLRRAISGLTAAETSAAPWNSLDNSLATDDEITIILATHPQFQSCRKSTESRSRPLL